MKQLENVFDEIAKVEQLGEDIIRASNYEIKEPYNQRVTKQSSYEITQSTVLVNQGLNSGQSICSHGSWSSVDDGHGRCKKCKYARNQHTVGFEYVEYDELFDTKIDFAQKEKYDKGVKVLEKSLPGFTTAVNEYQGLFQKLSENEQKIQEAEKQLQAKAANKNTYADVDTYEKMIESIKATESEGTERKVATIIQMINQRKAVSDAQAKEKVTYESQERTRYGFENYETRMEACIEMIRDGNPSSVRTLIGIIK